MSNALAVNQERGRERDDRTEDADDGTDVDVDEQQPTSCPKSDDDGCRLASCGSSPLLLVVAAAVAALVQQQNPQSAGNSDVTETLLVVAQQPLHQQKPPKRRGRQPHPSPFALASGGKCRSHEKKRVRKTKRDSFSMQAVRR